MNFMHSTRNASKDILQYYKEHNKH
jgi:hypothetical protein